jgi:hypothetical protein
VRQRTAVVIPLSRYDVILVSSPVPGAGRAARVEHP